jgi:hypothetical protein
MSNIPGLYLENIILVLVSYFLILLINRKTSSESVVLLFAILTFHHVVAYIYAFYLPLPQNEVDPAGFLYLASDCTNSGYCGYFGPHLYGTYLAKVLSLGQSVYFVFLLNVLFFVISIYYFIGIAEVLNLQGNRRIYIFLYSMWPSVVFYTTLNYREPFELYLLIAGIYFGLTGSQSDNFLRMLISMILLFIMGIFHMKGLTFLSPVLFIILLSYRFSFTVLSVAKKVTLLIIMSVAVYSSQGMYTDFLNEVSISKQETELENKISDNTKNDAEKAQEKVLTKNRLTYEKNKKDWLSNRNYPASDPSIFNIFMRKVTYYRESLTWEREPRTVFVSKISDSSIPAFIATYFLAYLEYLFSPFIFQVNSFPSLLAYAESVLRVFLFASTLMLVKRYPQVRVLFIIYLAITAMWAIGVVSYGASIRHHIQTNWILVLLGVPIIAEYISRKFFKKNDKSDMINRSYS